MKNTGRLLLALLTSLILGLGALVAVGGTATAAPGPCATQRAHVTKAKHHVAKDKKAVKHAKHAKHHRKAKVRRAKKKLHTDQRHLAKAQKAFKTCRANHSGSTGGGSTPPATGGGSASPLDALTSGCATIAQNVPGFGALCDAFGSFAGGGTPSLPGLPGLPGAGSGGAPDTSQLIAGCYTIGAFDTTGQFNSLCDAFASASGGGTPSLPGAPALP